MVFPMVSMVFPMVSMVFYGFSYGFDGFSYGFYGFSMVSKVVPLVFYKPSSRDPNTETKKVGTAGVFLVSVITYLLRRLPLDP